MSKFIANAIMKQANISLENGQNKYKSYFVNTTLYSKWKMEVDNILIMNDYGNCITY